MSDLLDALDRANTVTEPQRCADLMDEARLRIIQLEDALGPFARFGANSVDEDGWKDNEHRAHISTWFGPSEFRRARDVMGAQPDEE